MIRFDCMHCGRELTSSLENIGRSMSCPGCSKPVDIPAGEGPTAKPVAKGGRTGLFVLFALLVLGGGAIGIYWLTRPAGPGTPDLGDGPEVSDLLLLPANVQSVATVRWAELSSKPGAKDALGLMSKFDPKQEDPAVRIEREVNLKADEIDRLHFVGTSTDRQEGWVVVKTLEPMDRDRVLAGLKKRVEKRHEGRRYYLANRDDQEMAIHFAGPNVLVFAGEDSMKQAMAQATKPVIDGPLKAIIALSETSKAQVIAGLNPSAGGGAEALKSAPGGETLARAKAIRLTLDVDKEAILEARAQMADDKEAAEVRKSVSSTMGWASLGLPFAGIGRSAAERQALRDLGVVLSATKIENKSSEVILTTKAAPKTLTNGLVNGLPLLPSGK